MLIKREKIVKIEAESFFGPEHPSFKGRDMLLTDVVHGLYEFSYGHARAKDRRNGGWTVKITTTLHVRPSGTASSDPALWTNFIPKLLSLPLSHPSLLERLPQISTYLYSAVDSSSRIYLCVYR